MFLFKYIDIELDVDLVCFFVQKEWVFDFCEYCFDLLVYDLVELLDVIVKILDVWLVIFFYFGNDFYGIVMVGVFYVWVELNWENFDLIKVVV